MKNISLRQILIALSTITLITAATSCSSSSTTDIQNSTQDTENSANTESDTNPVTLTLLAYDSFTPTTNIFDDFTAQTGIKVNIALGGDAGELVTKAALTSGNPEADVLWGVDNTLISRALAAKIFAPYESKPSLVACS